MRWGAGIPQNIPGQDRLLCLGREGEEGKKVGGMSWGGPTSGAPFSLPRPRPFCWQREFEGPGGSSWGERSPQCLDKAQAHAPALFLHHINKDDEGRQSLLLLFPKCSQGLLRVTLPLLPPQAQLSPATRRP